jgi:hypothetical protein
MATPSRSPKRRAPEPLARALIRPTWYTVDSANFALTEFSEVRREPQSSTYKRIGLSSASYRALFSGVLSDRYGSDVSLRCVFPEQVVLHPLRLYACSTWQD